jgi:hypothetical protein
MSDNKNVYTTTTGLLALDTALANVLRSLPTDNAEATWEFLRYLAITSADPEIIEFSKDHSLDTRNQITIMQTGKSMTQVQDIPRYLEQQKYIKQRNEDLFEKLSLILKKKGYTFRIQRDIASNTSPSAQPLFER